MGAAACSALTEPARARLRAPRQPDGQAQQRGDLRLRVGGGPVSGTNRCDNLNHHGAAHRDNDCALGPVFVAAATGGVSVGPVTAGNGCSNVNEGGKVAQRNHCDTAGGFGAVSPVPVGGGPLTLGGSCRNLTVRS